MNSAFLLSLALVVGSVGALQLPKFPQLFTPRQSDAFSRFVIPEGRHCDHDRLTTAQNNFNKGLGITDGADWTESSVFIDDINKILKTGTSGLLSLCAARTKFYQDLGATYDSCMNRFHFLGHGYTNYEAQEYVKIFKQLEFMCNGGLLQSLSKWDCIESAEEPIRNAIMGCIETFKNTGGETYDTLCPAAEILMLCVRLPLYETCGKDAGWFECEMFRIILDIDSYCPHLTCSYNLAPMPRSKLKSRSVLFKEENPFFMPPEKQNLFASLGAKAEERMKRRKREIQN